MFMFFFFVFDFALGCWERRTTNADVVDKAENFGARAPARGLRVGCFALPEAEPCLVAVRHALHRTLAVVALLHLRRKCFKVLFQHPLRVVCEMNHMNEQTAQTTREREKTEDKKTKQKNQNKK